MLSIYFDVIQIITQIIQLYLNINTKLMDIILSFHNNLGSVQRLASF